MNVIDTDVHGIWELRYEGEGLIEKVTLRVNAGTYGMAQAFGDSFERILNDIDPRIKLKSMHEVRDQGNG